MSMLGRLGSVWLAGALFAAAALGADDAAREADHQALRNLRDQVAVAISKQDLPTLNTCLAKQFAFTTVNQRVATTPAQVKQIFDEFLGGPAAPLKSVHSEPSADALTRFLDDHTGIATGTSRETYVLRTGKAIVLQVRWTATVIKEDGLWKVATAHIGVDPMDNAMLTAATRFWQLLGAGGLVLGILLGVLLGRRSRRNAA